FFYYKHSFCLSKHNPFLLILYINIFIPIKSKVF
ncbi:hypothetical protein A5883_002294, partial [Enterococcus sp. 5B3_DIV0040]